MQTWWRVAMPLVRPVTAARGGADVRVHLVELPRPAGRTSTTGTCSRCRWHCARWPRWTRPTSRSSSPGRCSPPCRRWSCSALAQRRFLSRRPRWDGCDDETRSVRTLRLLAAVVLPRTACSRRRAVAATAPSGGGHRSSCWSSAPPRSWRRTGRSSTATRRPRPARPVQLVEASDRDDLITRLSTSIAGGEPPDVFLMNYRFYGQFAAKDAIEPLDDRLAASDADQAGGLLPGRDGRRSGGAASSCACRRTSPASPSTTTATCSRKYGVAEPQAGLDVERPDRHGAGADPRRERRPVVGHRDRGRPPPVAVYGLGVEPSMIRVAPFVWSNGGEIVDDPQRADPVHARHARRPARRCRTSSTCAWRTAWCRPTRRSRPRTTSRGSPTAGSRCCMSSRRVTTTFRAITDFDWDVAAAADLRPAG